MLARITETQYTNGRRDVCPLSKFQVTKQSRNYVFVVKIGLNYFSHSRAFVGYFRILKKLNLFLINLYCLCDSSFRNSF